MRALGLFVSLLVSSTVLATDGKASSAPARHLVIATKVSPPFAIKENDGRWTGISIELWEQVAQELDLPPTRYREMPLDQMFSALQAGQVSGAVAAISMTPEREQRVDFTHPYHHTGLGVAVSAKRAGGRWRTLISRLFTWQVPAVIGASIVWLVLVGAVFWLAERRSNPLYRDAGPRRGIGLGIWWALTVLLGNKGVLPSSTLSRVLAFSGMLTSVLLLVTVTGAIASYLTISQLDSLIRQPQDLTHLRIVAPAQTTSADFLREIHVSYAPVADVAAGMDSVANGDADAIVYDAPVLKHLANTTYINRVSVLPLIFHSQEYAIALPAGSELREPINRALLRLRQQKWWEDLLHRYLGSPG